MSIAQQLYEGVEISGHGSIGLITYMRTDSLRLSEEALAAARDYITEHYGPEYYPGKPRHFKTKAGAQDAHEAIRPTDVTLTPELVRKDLTQEQYRLYRLIWGRFTACQMANAVYDNVSVDIDSAGYTFRANYSELKFKGYTAVYEEAKDEESSELANPLPSLSEGQQLKLEKLMSEQQFTQPPARYTEATLIRAMEEKGIGRPSTYAPTISSITARDYVIKEGKYLKPTPLGQVVTGLMKERFADIVDLKFTNQMEAELDEIESGKAEWRSVLENFYGDFSKELHEAEEALDGVRLKVPDVLSDEYCEVCGRQMVVKKGRFGYFLACPGFPECTFTKPIVIEMPGKCPKCGGRILKRTSKKGYVFYACERGTDCGFITWDVPTKDFCPICGKTMFKHSGRGPLKSFCINEECPNFVPEDKRTYKKKTPEEKAEAEAKEGREEGRRRGKESRGGSREESRRQKKTAAKKTTAKKTTTRKTASKKAAGGGISHGTGNGTGRGPRRERVRLAAGKARRPCAPCGDEAGEDDPGPLLPVFRGAGLLQLPAKRRAVQRRRPSEGRDARHGLAHHGERGPQPRGGGRRAGRGPRGLCPDHHGKAGGAIRISRSSPPRRPRSRTGKWSSPPAPSPATPSPRRSPPSARTATCTFTTRWPPSSRSRAWTWTAPSSPPATTRGRRIM